MDKSRKDYDFGGWATKNDIRCSDGRIIRKDAFKHNSGQTVPLVWNHSHNDPLNVLGHALLENRENGVYAYCKFNNTEQGSNAKELVAHGDVVSLSIYANQLKQKGTDVLHGAIKEVSLVLAGANSGARIEEVMVHGEEAENEAVLYMGDFISLSHADDPQVEPKVEKKEEEPKVAEKEKTVKEIFDSFTEEQKDVVYAMIGQAVEDAENKEKEDPEGGDEQMKHNLFENEEDVQDNTLSHADVKSIFEDAKRYGSLKDSVLAHAETQGYGIENIDFLFPDARTLDTPPQFIQRENKWVQKVINGAHHTPFSRIKSLFADITEDEARAKGYIKGNLKKEEVFSLLKRTTTPTTIYKKQKLDRDDVVDITDFDVVVWLKAEMRLMLDEEIARAALVGDGRLASSDDKINEQNIRPIWKDESLFTIQATVKVTADITPDAKAKKFIRTAIKSRKDYKGSGNPTLFTTEDHLTDCLLLEDNNGRIIYDSVEKLATVLRVKEIVTVPVMEGLSRKRTVDETEVDAALMAIMVNMDDYNIGADKGGAINMFDDFDIDYNQQKYLIETRCSGALTKPYSAIVLESITTATAGQG